MTRIRGIAEIVAAALVLGALCGSLPALGQTAPATPPADPANPPANPWAFRITPYGWLTWMSGSQTVKGRTTDTDTNVFQLLGQSQSLIPFMAYFEARYEDRISLFVDVLYANITAGEQANKNFRVNRFVGGSVAAAASVDYEQLTVEFGGAYEYARLGRDRSGEGPGMARVGQTALDVLVGGRYWYQKADMTLNLNGTIGVNIGDLERSRDASRAVARSGGVNWSTPSSASGSATGWRRARICRSRRISAALVSAASSRGRPSPATASSSARQAASVGPASSATARSTSTTSRARATRCSRPTCSSTARCSASARDSRRRVHVQHDQIETADRPQDGRRAEASSSDLPVHAHLRRRDSLFQDVDPE